MPCDSSHMEPTGKERQSKQAAELIVYAANALTVMGNQTIIPSWISNAAESIYGSSHKVDSLFEILCEMCSNMSTKEQGQIMYDGRNPMARCLADWWDRHQEADAKREAMEKKQKEQVELRRSALAKLTDKEKAALLS